MRLRSTLAVLCLACCSATVPASQPVCAPTQMAAELTAPVSFRTEVPLTLTFVRDTDAIRTYKDTSFLFLLLGQDGKQVNGPNGVFVFSEVSRAVELGGKAPTYKPKMILNHYCRALQAGSKYQLIAIMPTTRLAGSVWFTLAN